MSSRWVGFFVWALVAASTAFWGMKIFAASRPLPAGALAPQIAVAAAGPMDRLFGAVLVPTAAIAAPHPESERFQLVGVIAAPNGARSASGLAIVTIDGQPAKPWHVGSTLDGNTTLLAVARRTADFGPSGGPTAFTLQLPEPSAPATGIPGAAISGVTSGVTVAAAPGGQQQAQTLSQIQAQLQAQQAQMHAQAQAANQAMAQTASPPGGNSQPGATGLRRGGGAAPNRPQNLPAMGLGTAPGPINGQGAASDASGRAELE